MGARLEKIRNLLMYTLVFFTPIIFGTNTFEAYEFPKMMFVYIVGGLLILTNILQNKIKIEKSDLPVILFLIAYIIATVFSSHKYTSLWGYYTRFNGSLISMFVFTGIYLVFKNIGNAEKDKVYRLLALTLVPISLLGILQKLTETRVYSTIGQPNWLAAYIVMLVPILFKFILESKNKKTRLLWGALYLLSFTTLWLTYSLSGMLGFLIMSGVFLLLNKWNKVFYILGLLSVIVALLNPGIFAGKINDVYLDIRKGFTANAQIETKINNKETNKNGNENEISDPGYIRTSLWKSTWELIKNDQKTFFIGTGPETYPYEIQNHRNKALNYSSEWNFVFNKPHNYFLELFSNIGFLGLFAYLYLLGSTLRMKNPLITPILAGFIVTNFFGWPTVSTNLVFWGMLGFCGNYSGKPRNNSNKSVPEKAFFTILFAFLAFFSWQAMSADESYTVSQDFLKNQEYERAFDYANKSISKNPYEPRYYYGRAKIYLVKGSVKHLALEDLEKAEDLNSRNLVTLRNMVPIYYFLTVEDLNKPNAVKNIDENYINITRDYYNKIKAQYPNDVGAQTIVAKYENKLGLEENLRRSVQNIRDLRPDLLEWYLTL